MCTYKLSYLARSKPVGVRIYMHIHKNIYMGMIDGVSYSVAAADGRHARREDAIQELEEEGEGERGG